MPAPKSPNTAAATAAVRRRGQETAAAKLRQAGWLVTPPEGATSAEANFEGRRATPEEEVARGPLLAALTGQADASVFLRCYIDPDSRQLDFTVEASEGVDSDMIKAMFAKALEVMP